MRARRIMEVRSKGYIPFVWKLYYFRPNVILLSSECYITFRQMLYYFRVKVILLFLRSYITFLRSLLEPLTKAL